LNPNIDWAKRKRDFKGWLGVILSILGFAWAILATFGVIPTLR
jgi:hypothetical protein